MRVGRTRKNQAQVELFLVFDLLTMMNILDIYTGFLLMFLTS
jgi:hypothetical protein